MSSFKLREQGAASEDYSWLSGRGRECAVIMFLGFSALLVWLLYIYGIQIRFVDGCAVR